MPLHGLPAGTDTAEMALFDPDLVPQSPPRTEEDFDDLITQGGFIRLPTDGDGGYLLHLYVDESPPTKIAQFCVAEDRLAGRFASAKGRISFGGVESAFREFKPNRFIRSDAEIAPGTTHSRLIKPIFLMR